MREVISKLRIQSRRSGEDSSATRTIRLDKDIEDVLQKVANDQKTTVNRIVNAALRRYSDWDRHAENFDLMETGPFLLTELMAAKSVDEAKELGRRTAKDVMRPLIELMMGDFSFSSVLEFLRRAAKYTHRYNFEEIVTGRQHLLLVRHPMGLPWSAFYEGALRELFEDGLGLKIKVSIGAEACVARVEV